MSLSALPPCTNWVRLYALGPYTRVQSGDDNRQALSLMLYMRNKSCRSGKAGPFASLMSLSRRRVAESRSRQIEDLLAEVEFLLVQLVVLDRSSGPHHNAHQQQRISRLHRRLDMAEHQLRAHASEFGLDAHVTLGQLRRSLVEMLHDKEEPTGSNLGREGAAAAEPHAKPSRPRREIALDFTDGASVVRNSYIEAGLANNWP